MTDCNCNNNLAGNYSCGSFAVFFSLVLGAVAAALFANGFVPQTTALLWIIFGLGVLVLILAFTLILASALSECDTLINCACRNGVCLLISTLGTIFFAIVGIAAGIADPTVAAIILVGIIVFFFILMLLSLATFLICILALLCRIN